MKNLLRHSIFRILLFIMLVGVASADAYADRPSSRERDSWMKEMQQVKNEFIAKKLDLTEQQKAKFLPLYQKMDAELRKTVEETRRMAREVRKKGDAATDLEYEKAAEALFECKGRECEIEKRYFAEFKKVLSPRQLFKLKDAEKDFTKQLMKEHRKKKSNGKSKK